MNAEISKLSDLAIPADRKIAISRIEAMMIDGPPVKIPITHRFTPGLYIRECHIPQGCLVTTMEHLTEHPFFILKGQVLVTSTTSSEEVIYKAPFTGITSPGTKRLIYALLDTTWITVHANPDNQTDPDEIGKRILDLTPNPLLIGADPARVDGWKKDSTYQDHGKLSSS